MAECMHGFEAGQCDICFPRTGVEHPSTAPTRVVRKAPRAPHTSSTPPAIRGLPPFGARRLYHVTHERNLESILLDGAIRPVASGVEPDLDVSAPIIRELRARADVGDGRSVDRFVPFFLSPDAARWAELREGAEGAHWSAAARATAATEYVMLVVQSKSLGKDVVIADGDASAPRTRFTIGDPAGAVARAARADPELANAEVLVPGQVPLDAVVLMGVASEPMRSRLRADFRLVEAAPPKIAVHPPWFVPDAS